VLAVDDNQALVPDPAGQDSDLAPDLVQRENPPGFLRIAAAEAAVSTVVDAQIAQVQRGEGHNAVVVNLPLDRRRRLRHLGPKLRVLDVQQAGRLVRRQRLDGQRLLQNLPHPPRVGMRVRRQRPRDSRVVDKAPAVVEIPLDLLRPDSIPDPAATSGTWLFVLYYAHLHHPLTQPSDELYVICPVERSISSPVISSGAKRSREIWPRT
jgi:hypothetical protein